MSERSSLGRAAAWALAAAALAGCAPKGPNFQPPAATGVPAAWQAAKAAPATLSEPVPEPPDPHWWSLFGDPTLTGLETRVAAQNLDVQQAGLKLAQSRAALGVAASAEFPVADANASFGRQQLSRKGALSLVGGGPATASNGNSGTSGAVQNTGLFAPFDLYQYGFDATWEIDFWGRVRRGVEAASANVQATEEARRQTLLVALGEMARDYIRLRATQRALEITNANLGTARQSLKLTQDRAAGGLTTDLDVANAAAQVANIAAELPALEAAQDRLINAIALLLGLPPRSMSAELADAHPIPSVPPRVPVGLPSDLARRRPDIRRAEAQPHEATADVGVAVADFYPRITLSGSAAIQATQFAEMGNWAQANTWAWGPSISLPIFEGGRLHRVLEVRQTQQKEAALAYHQTVLAALHEVDNAMTAYQAEQLRQIQLQEAVVQHRRALKLAQERYAQGVADFLAVLDAQRGLLASEQALTQTTAAVSTNLVQIYLAIGGGWQSDLPETPAPVAPPLAWQDLTP